MNIFHWHITDTHSFPLKLKSVPELAQYGAYSQEKTYSASDVKELVEYARGRFSEQLINNYLQGATIVLAPPLLHSYVSSRGGANTVAAPCLNVRFIK